MKCYRQSDGTKWSTTQIGIQFETIERRLHKLELVPMYNRMSQIETQDQRQMVERLLNTNRKAMAKLEKELIQTNKELEQRLWILETKYKQMEAKYEQSL